MVERGSNPSACWVDATKGAAVAERVDSVIVKRKGSKGRGEKKKRKSFEIRQSRALEGYEGGGRGWDEKVTE